MEEEGPALCLQGTGVLVCGTCEACQVRVQKNTIQGYKKGSEGEINSREVKVFFCFYRCIQNPIKRRRVLAKESGCLVELGLKGSVKEGQERDVSNESRKREEDIASSLTNLSLRNRYGKDIEMLSSYQ